MLTSDMDIALAAAYVRLTNTDRYNHSDLPSYSLAKAILSDSVEGEGVIGEYSQNKIERLFDWLLAVYHPEDQVISGEHVARMRASLHQLFSEQQVLTYQHTSDTQRRPSPTEKTITFTVFSSWFREECEWVLSRRHHHGDDGTEGAANAAEEIGVIRSI
jgi:hypothetical protein